MSKLRNLQKYDLIVITGPTASGKTNISIELAKEINSEIISADSRQVYKLMDICTAKPSPIELNSVKHHLIDFLDPNENYSAGKFVEDAEKLIKKISHKGKIPIICGGTYFYIKSLIDGLFEEGNTNQESDIRKKLNEEYEKYGIEKLQEELKKYDLETYNRIELDNPHRIIRALEYYFRTGEKISLAYNLRNAQKSHYKTIYFAIDYPRDILYNRINQRCENMWNNGIIDEYKNLINLNYEFNLNSLNTVGYNEVKLYLDNILNKEQALNEFKKNTRRYAKRQLTWLRKNNNINWIDYSLENKIEYIKNKITE